MPSPHPTPGRARHPARTLLIAGLLTLALIGPALEHATPAMTLAHAQPATGPMALSNNTLPQPLLDHKATLVAAYKPSQMLRIVFSLQPPHAAEEQQFLRDVQTKGSPLFHHFLSADEWNARFGPTLQDEQAVLDWAQTQGLPVTHRYPNRLLVDVAAPVSAVQAAFHVSINTYTSDNRTFFSNDRAPTLPAQLSGIVEAVLGLNNWETAHPANARFDTSAITTAPAYVPGPVVALGTGLRKNGDPTKLPATLKTALPRQNGISPHAASPVIPHLQPHSTGGAYDPTDVYSSQMYDYDALQALGHCCNPTGAPESLPQGSIAIATAFAAKGSDITGWGNQYPYLAYDVQPISIDGTPSTDGGGETTVDTDWTIATANSFGCFCTTAKVWLYEGANANLSTFDDVYNQILTDGHARSFSTSWGCTEFTCASNDTMDTDENIFDAMVGQGWTLSVAADDRGAFADCDGQFKVQFPAASPDVVAAGGTNLNLDSSNGAYVDEHAWVGGSGAGPCQASYGGGGGGCSFKFPQMAPWQIPVNFCPDGDRNMPDLSLNADFGPSPQNIFLDGSLQGSGGTSIVAPELAGFFAQEDAYLLALGNGPLGNPAPAIFANGTGKGEGFPPHDPYYDITSGQTNGGTGNSASVGYDPATGWGSANMLQLAWSLNWQVLADFGPPDVSFSGPAINRWYNMDQLVNWSIFDTAGINTPSGVAGYSSAWDVDPGDPTGHGTPGCCDSFYTGPRVPNGTSGSLDLAAAGQGCHTVHVRAWDNTGLGNGDQTYGPLCYDTTAPHTTAGLSGVSQGGTSFLAPVQVTLSTSDDLSGIAGTTYQIDGASVQTYSTPFNVSAAGWHTVAFDSTDVAGNVESTQSVSFTIVNAPTATPTKAPTKVPTPTATKTPVPPTKTPTPAPTATKTPTPTPKMGVTPSRAHAGARVTVDGRAFGAHETVTLKYNCGQPACTSTTVLGTASTDGAGNFSVAVRLPSTAPLGVHAIGAKGGTSGDFASTTITIIIT